MSECVCKGNWRLIVEEAQNLFGKAFRKECGQVGCFVGVMHGEDDYYYVMSFDGRAEYFSCVGSLEMYGIEEVRG